MKSRGPGRGVVLLGERGLEEGRLWGSVSCPMVT